ncbi:hypothetical protein [Streptomyces sp. NPDC048419]|uniref:hypothetical protein n=1 Tax=Streptomyces sp. NPDC048419 TaxID=3365547 RepID=UPI00371B8D56
MQTLQFPGVVSVTRAAIRAARYYELRHLCDTQDFYELSYLLHELARQDTIFRREMSQAPLLLPADFARIQHDFWYDLRHYLARFSRVPYQGVYFGHRHDRVSRGRTPFLAEAFRALDTYTGNTLDIYLSPADLTAPGEATEDPAMYDQFAGFLGAHMPPSLDTLYVWKTPDPHQEDPRFRPKPLRLGHFHRDARIGAIAKLALLLEARIPLAEAVREAWEHPVAPNAAELEGLLPGSSLRHRKAARIWARAYAARYGGQAQAETAARIIADLRSPSRARRATASATVAAVLTVTGVLGAPHVLTNDLPDTYTVIHDLYRDITGDHG